MSDEEFKAWIQGMRDNPETIGKGTILLDFVEKLWQDKKTLCDLVDYDTKHLFRLEDENRALKEALKNR